MAQQAIVPPQNSSVTRRTEFFREVATSIRVTIACLLAALLAVAAVFAVSVVVLQLVALIGGVPAVVLTWSVALMIVAATPTAVVRAVVSVLESLEPVTADRQEI